MAALRPENRDAGQADKPAMRRDWDAGDAEALRRRIEEPKLGNAVMREVVEVVKKDPGADLRLLSNRERTLPADCHDGRIVACTAGSCPDAGLADRMLARAAETLPEGAHPLARSDCGRHCRWSGWLALMDRYGLARSTGAKGCSPDNAAAEGFFGRMKTESVYPGRWEERTRDGVLVPVDDCIRWCDHARIKRSLVWMSPVQYRQSRGMAA